MDFTEFLINDLPDPDSARRFFIQFVDNHPSYAAKLNKNRALLSDVLTLSAYSNLLAATLLQNPEYLWWLNRKREESRVRTKDDLLESLARFSLTHSLLDIQVLLARFRRRELLRIYLRDIRRLATIAEITEEISNLADAVLEHALRTARQQLENRHGSPLEKDEKGRSRPAEFCIVAVGKLGSKELNYSSDIDLIFIYSADGETSDSGTKGSLTNREYFVKLAENVTKIVGRQTGEGAAYRIDLRLRPRGSIGAITLSLAETTEYYRVEARNWERQVLIRSRACAGDPDIFKKFYSDVENAIFSIDENSKQVLDSVRHSKEKIDKENRKNNGFNVKLGQGGIREIEFISQALQLAHGGHDPWLRSPHTLISLARLADRGLLTKTELTGLFNAYEFLRRLEHILQMENGLQTHDLPTDKDKLLVISKKMRLSSLAEFEYELAGHRENTRRVFMRILDERDYCNNNKSSIGAQQLGGNSFIAADNQVALLSDIPARSVTSYSNAEIAVAPSNVESEIIKRLSKMSPSFSGMLAANPQLALELPNMNTSLLSKNYREILNKAVISASDFHNQLDALRKAWLRSIFEIAVYDVFEKISLKETKNFQTQLAEAGIEAGIYISQHELARRINTEVSDLPLAVLGLGKLGGGGMDYESDLDLVLVYDGVQPIADCGLSEQEFYSRIIEIFITTLSDITRCGSLYRVDLRLRPYGRNGSSVNSRTAFFEYFQHSANIWELLAFVKLRGVGGNLPLAIAIESEIRNVIHEKALSLGVNELKRETMRVRLLLESEKSSKRRVDDIDIKYGPGGMLDIYFATRFLQLRDNVPDDADNRSTETVLRKLFENASLTKDDFSAFLAGYNFLTALDHNIRLTIGRSTRLPVANRHVLQTIAARMKLDSISDLLENLALHRINIRSIFDKILSV